MYTLFVRGWFFVFLVVPILGCSSQSEYPSRPITIVCPWSPGGGTDRVSRQIAIFLETELGKPVNVVNATGGQGVTGHSKGLKARPDGYTVSMMTLELSMMHWRKLTNLTYQDSIPLMSVNEDAAALFVRADAPWPSLAELRQAVQQNPKQLKASGTAYLGAWHLALAGWLISMDMDPGAIVWVPQKGAGPSLQELMSGGLDMVCCSLPEARSLYLQGEVRCLGVMAEERVNSEAFADVPTFIEQGSDWTLVGWRGLGLPLGAPQQIQDRLVAALERIVSGETQVNGETFPEFMEKQEFDHTWRKTTDFAKFLAANDEQFGKILGRDEFAPVSSGPVGPMHFPGVLLALLAVFVPSVVAMEWRKQQAIRSEMAEEPSPSEKGTGNVTNLLLVLAAVVVYILVADQLGFLLTASGLLFLLLWRFGNRPAVSLLISVVLTPIIYQLFAGVLRVSLPFGVFGW